MDTIPENAIRIKRFRELKATLRTRRDRLLVGIDIAKAQHVAQVRLAHTRILEPKLSIPNTHAGFAACWARLDVYRGQAGVREIVCAVEPTGADKYDGTERHCSGRLSPGPRAFTEDHNRVGTGGISLDAKKTAGSCQWRDTVAHARRVPGDPTRTVAEALAEERARLLALRRTRRRPRDAHPRL